MKYAIIVPNYNNDHGSYKDKTYLRNCIDSILNQTYKDENYYLIYEYVGKVEVQEFDDILSLESYINFMQIENYNIIKGVMIHEGSKED